MSGRFFNPQDDAIFASLNAQRERRDAIVANPQTAELLDTYGRQAPYIRPDAALPLAKANIQPNQQIINAAAKAKASSGFGFHLLGDIVTATGKGLSGVAKTVGGAVSSVAKPVVRTAFTAASAPYEEMQGDFRNLVREGPGYLKKKATYELPYQSSAIIALEKLARGERVDLGSGFFPQGQVRQEQVQRARASHQTGGRATTPGRYLANGVTEPGTKPYTLISGLVDFSLALADPTAKGLGAASKANKGRKLFVNPNDPKVMAGAIDGPRSTVLPERAEAWLAGDGRKVAEKISGINSVPELRRVLGKKVDTETIVGLADARTTDEVMDVLRPRLGIQIREKFDTGGVTNAIKNTNMPVFNRSLKQVRLFNQMPGTHIDLDDLDDAVNQVERWGANAKLPQALIDSHVDQMARSKNRIERYKVVSTMLKDTMTQIGGDAQQGRRLTTMFRDYHEEMAKYFVDEIGNNVPVLGAKILGNDYALPTPHLFTEYINKALPLPDAREVRRATSRFKNLLDSPGVEFTQNVADSVINGVWKPLALLRGAYTVRVIGEEQIRMAGAGLDAMPSHPLSFIAYRMGKRGANDITGEDFKVASDASTVDDMDEFAKAMSQGSGGWRDRIVAGAKVNVRRDQEEYPQALGDELMQLRSDPLGRKVAGGWSKKELDSGKLTGNHVEDAKKWFWDGDGKKIREEMSQAEGREALARRDVSDAYVDSVFQRLQVKTQGDVDLMNAVATGRVGEAGIRNGHKLSKDFLNLISTKAQAGLTPDVAKGDLILAARSGKDKVKVQMDNAVEHMFEVLMTNRTNNLSRSPSFKQFYWQRAPELLPHMTKADQAKVLKAAEQANLPRKQMATIRKFASQGEGKLTLDEADHVAKGFALDKTKNLLYDMHKRSQFFDITRLLFPFGEAWKEVLTTWAKIGTENPQVLRRGQQVIEGARGAGFFYTDETTGEEMFAYPGSEMLNEKVIGVSAPFVAPVKGLNIFGTVLPGFGPAVTWPASRFMPDDEAWAEVRNIILPYGEINDEGGTIESFLPAWMQKFRQTGLLGPRADEKKYNDTVSDIARYLVNVKGATIDSPEDLEAVHAEAGRLAPRMFALRGLAQFFAPSPPTPRFIAEDKDGKRMVATVLVQDLAKMQKDDPDNAVGNFLEKYGDDALLYLQPKTQGKFSPTKEAGEWLRDNPKIASQYPDTYGFFAPAGEDFDVDAYSRQIARGERVPVEARQALTQANARVASFVYRKATEDMGSTAEEMEWKAQLRDALSQEYPGYPGNYDRSKIPRQITEIQSAIKNPKLAKTDAGQAISIYLAQRDEMNKVAKDRGRTTFNRSKDTADIRQYMRDLGNELVKEHPDFANAWERVFNNEMEEDEPETEEQ